MKSRNIILVLMALVLMVQVNAAVTTQAYYDLSGAAGAVGSPVSGTGANPVDLTAYGDPQYTGVGTVDFDGAGDYLQGADGDLPTTAVDNIGMEAYFKADSYGAFQFVANIGGGGGNLGGMGMLVQDFGSGQQYHILYNGVKLAGTSTSGAVTGQWVHVAIVIDGGTSRLFVNGVEEATDPEAGALTAYGAGDFMTIAGNPWDVPNGVLDGEIDYVHVFTFDAGAFKPTDLDQFSRANTPDPTDTEDGVAIDKQLGWLAPDGYDVSGYDVYFGTDANTLSAGYDMEKIVDNQIVLTADPADHSTLTDDMDNEVTYYWQVDTYEPNLVGAQVPTLHPGVIWSFTTTPAVPFFNSQPADSDPTRDGEDASFDVTVTSTTAVTFAWYKDGAGEIIDDDVNYDIVSDTLTSTLTILGVEAGDAGDYYCIATNTAGPAQSDMAELIYATLIGHWPFDSDFTDMVGSNDGVPTPASARAFTPVIGISDANSIIDGGAAVFSSTYVGYDNDPAGGAVVIPTPTRLLANNSFTISFWEKSNSEESSRYHIASGTDDAGIDNFFMWRYFDDEFFATNIGPWTGAYPLLTGDLYPEDQWYFLAVTYDANTGDAVTYVNGVADATGNIAAFTGFASEIYVGNRKNMARPFSGSLDDLKIYNYPLDSTEVADAYVSEVGGTVCMETIEFDLTGPEGTPDCKVDIYDLREILSDWLECGIYPDCI